MLTKLRTLRVERNMTQEDLAQALGTTQKSVSAWERGKITPRPSMMQKIADYFGVNKDDIFFSAFNYLKQLNKLKMLFELIKMVRRDENERLSNHEK